MALALSAVSALAGGDPKPGATPGQGIAGHVVKLAGNFMPAPVLAGTPPPAKGKRTPLAVPVHVFKGVVHVAQKPDPKHPQLVTTVIADADGAFKVPLAPGDYTVVAEIDGRLYLNLVTMGPGGACWATVNVEPGRWTACEIQDTRAAAF